MKMKPIMEFCTLNMGQSPDSETYNENGIGLPFYQGNADFGEIHPKTRVWCSAPNKVASADDILISVRAPIGALNIAVEKCCIGRGLAALTPKLNVCDLWYLYYALCSRVDFLNSRGTGSTFKAIGKKTLEEVLIPAHSLMEQKQIAVKLSYIDKLISNVKRQVLVLEKLVQSKLEVQKSLEKLETLKKSLMQQYFGQEGTE